MYNLRENNNIIVFGAGEIGLIESINTAGRKGSINLSLPRDGEESNFSCFQ